MNKKELQQHLKSSFSEKEYADVEKNFHQITNHIQDLTLYIQEDILPGLKKDSFLDVGAGPGYIAKIIAPSFKKVVLLDSNKEYQKYYEKLCCDSKFLFRIENFEDSLFDEKFSFILCSHMLYHIKAREWKTILQKVFSLLLPRGAALLSLIASRGSFHKLCHSINSSYLNSSFLLNILKEVQIPYKVSKRKTLYQHTDISKFQNLVQVFAIDDCFFPDEYFSLSEKSKKTIHKRIKEFVANCYDQEKKVYRFHCEEDYVTILNN